MKPTVIPPVVALIGPDRFLRDEALRDLVSRMGNEVDELGPRRFDGEDAECSEVLDEVRTASLLGGRRVAIVDGADALIRRFRRHLEDYVGNPTASGVLILECDQLPRNTRLYKLLSAAGGVVDCGPPASRRMAAWIEERARKIHGKKMSGRAAERLREYLGDSPGLLDAELGKLVAFIGSRPEIREEDVEVLTGRLREQNVFAVMDALAGGDVTGALGAWERVWATDRAAPGRAIAGLAWAVRRLLTARRARDRGTPLTVLAKQMFTDPIRLEHQFFQFTVEDLERQQRDLLEADLAVKTGAASVDRVIERFIVKHGIRETNSNPRYGLAAAVS